MDQVSKEHQNQLSSANTARNESPTRMDKVNKALVPNKRSTKTESNGELETPTIIQTEKSEFNSFYLISALPKSISLISPPSVKSTFSGFKSK